MTKERFDKTSYKMTYEEYLLCDCCECDKENCKHRNAYRRFPEIDGGLGLCPRLAEQAKQKRRGGATYANDRTCR